jgi:hypothetical protein
MSASPDSPESQNTMADAPFNDTRADVILRSSDGVDFRVFKIIISLASPIFADMFSIPSPSTAGSEIIHDGLPVVQLSECSKNLNLALRHCYPIRSPGLAEPKDALALLEFERKYQVDALGPPLMRYLTSAIEHDPVSAFCLAVKYQYEDIVKAAARSCLKLPISKFKRDVLCSITGEEYQALIEYHNACGAAASAVTLQRDWFPPSDKLFPIATPRRGASNDSPCTACIMDDIDISIKLSPFSSGRRAPRYLWSYLHRSALLLLRHPSAEAVTAEAFVLKGLDCPHCSDNRRADMLDFSRFFALEVQRAIEKVIGYSGKVCFH